MVTYGLLLAPEGREIVETLMLAYLKPSNTRKSGHSRDIRNFFQSVSSMNKVLVPSGQGLKPIQYLHT